MTRGIKQMTDPTSILGLILAFLGLVQNHLHNAQRSPRSRRGR